MTDGEPCVDEVAPGGALQLVGRERCDPFGLRGISRPVAGGDRLIELEGDGHRAVALDRQLKVRIDHHDDGSVGGELVMVVPARQLADGSAQGEHLATLGFPGR